MENAGAATCGVDKQTLQMAVDAYAAMNTTPPTEAALVPDFLREQVVGWDLDANGDIVPAPGGPCA